MNVGCVTEIKKHEYRVGLTPGNARSYIAHGHSVFVQKGLGLGSSFKDEEYEAAGAKICDTAQEVYAVSDMIIKVKEPLEAEYELMREGQILYTYLHLAADEALTRTLMKRGVTGVAYETIRDDAGALPLLNPMSEIAGRLSLQEGAKALEKPMGGRGVLLSGVPGVEKAHVVILGAGAVGSNACKLAIGMGADVTILDINLKRLAYLDDLYGGSLQTLYSSEESLQKSLAKADLVIGAVLIPGGRTPRLVRREHLKFMQPGSVIVDVAIDQGGCCETSRATYHDDPTFVVDGVVHYCVGNMPGAVPRTSTIALTNATQFYGLLLADNGVKEAINKNSGLLPGVNTYGGKCTYKGVADAFNIEYTDVSTLL